MKISSFSGALKLLKAIRKQAIRDEIEFKRNGFKNGENAWEEWIDSECRYIYYHSYLILKHIIEKQNLNKNIKNNSCDGEID